jgi:hypothetical protein
MSRVDMCVNIVERRAAEEALRIIPASGDEPLLSNHLPPQDDCHSPTSMTPNTQRPHAWPLVHTHTTAIPRQCNYDYHHPTQSDHTSCDAAAYENYVIVALKEQ